MNLKLTPQLDLIVEDGDLKMSSFPEDAISIALFTKKGWWGDALLDGQIGSDLHQYKMNTPIAKAQKSIVAALAWMSEYTVEARVERVAGRLDFSVTLAKKNVEETNEPTPIVKLPFSLTSNGLLFSDGGFLLFTDAGTPETST